MRIEIIKVGPLKTNCYLIMKDQKCLIVDPGSDYFLIEPHLKNMQVIGVLITHEHSDHIRGAGIISRKFGVPIYANEKTWNAMEINIGEIDSKNKVCFTNGELFAIGDIEIKSFKSFLFLFKENTFDG